MGGSGAAQGAPPGHRPRPPRLGLQGTARPGRGGPQGGPPARRGGHLQPRTGHRHGRGGPRDPGRVAPLRRLRPAAGGPRGPPGGRGLHRRGLPEVPRRPGPGGRRHRAHAHRLHRVPQGPRQPPGRPRPADRRDDGAWTPGSSTTSSPPSAGPPPSPPFPSPRSRPSSTCSPAATRPTPSRNCAPAWSGTASPARSPAGPAPSASPSPPAARSPTAASSASSSPGADPKKGGGRVGELDEEMVYESRVGDVFTLGTSSWRIEDITRDRVLVSPAPGVPGRLPFWKGDQLGRPLELGRAVGAFLREVGSLPKDDARLRLLAAGLDAWAADNVLSYLDEQREACGHIPDDRTIVVERFRDELGDWRVVVHSPFGAQVHAPWALALGAKLSERYGMDAQVMHADDGIVLRLPDADLMGLDLLDQEPTKDRHGVRRRPGPRRRRGRRLRQGRGRPDRHRPGRRLGPVRLPLPRVRRPRAAAAPPQPRQAHPAVAAAPARGPTAPGGQRVRLVPDRPGGGPRMPPGRLRRPRPRRADGRPGVPQGPPRRGHHPRALPLRPLPPLRLRRPVPVRGRLAARRAPRGGPLAGLASAGRAARPGGAARAAGRRGADRAGAGAPVAHRGPPRQGRRRRRRPPAPPRPAHGRRAGRARRRAAVGPGPGAAPAARSGSGSPAPTTGRRSRTRAACATRSAPHCRSASRRRSPSRSRTRSATSSPATPAPTARSPPPRPPPASAWARRSPRAPCSGSPASGRVVQGEFHPAGIGQEWCDATVLRRLRRRSLAALRHELEPVPPRRARPVPPPVAAHRQGPRPARHRRTGACRRAVAGRVRAGLRPGEARPAVPRRELHPGHARRTHRRRRGRLGRSGRAPRQGRLGLPVPGGRGPPAPAAAAPPGADGAPPVRPGRPLRRLRPVLPPDRRPGPRHHPPRRHRSPTGRRRMGPGLVRPAHQRHPRPHALPAGLGPHRRFHRPPRQAHDPARALRLPHRRRPHRLPHRPADRRRPLVPAARPPKPDPTVRAHALARTLLDRHGVVTRGAVAAEGVEGGFSATYRILSAFEDSGQARRGYVVEGLGAAQFAMDGAVDRLRAVANARDRGEPVPGPSPAPPRGPDSSGPGSDGTATGRLRLGRTPSALFAHRPSHRTEHPTRPTDGRRRPGHLGSSQPGPTPPSPASRERVHLAARLPPGPGRPGPYAPPTARLTASRSRTHTAPPTPPEPSSSPPPTPRTPTAPPSPGPTRRPSAGHKPGRKAGSLVVLVDGELTLYMERGGKTLLAWPSDPDSRPPTTPACTRRPKPSPRPPGPAPSAPSRWSASTAPRP